MGVKKIEVTFNCKVHGNIESFFLVGKKKFCPDCLSEYIESEIPEVEVDLNYSYDGDVKTRVCEHCKKDRIDDDRVCSECGV